MKKLRIVWIVWMTLGWFVSFAQYDPDYYDADQRTVVAVNGLKLRTKPSLAGKVIDKIPYGEQVTIQESRSYGHDTLPSNYKVYYNEQEDPYEPILSGDWVKAAYDEQEGYVFSGFLYYQYATDNNYNKKMALLFEGGNCHDNLHYRPDWHWYGLYGSEGVQQLRKVQIDIFVEETDMGPSLTITTDQQQPSILLLGSPRPLAERRLFFSNYLGYGASIYEGEEIDEELLQEAALEIIEGEGEDYPKLVALGSQGERQVLNPEAAYFGYPAVLHWFGDLDGDGEMDYLVTYGEKSARTVLYLSSKAKTGQLVAPVGVYYDGYCC